MQSSVPVAFILILVLCEQVQKLSSSVAPQLEHKIYNCLKTISLIFKVRESQWIKKCYFLARKKKCILIVRHLLTSFKNSNSLSHINIISLKLKRNVNSDTELKINSLWVKWLISCGFISQGHTLWACTCSVLICHALSRRGKIISLEEQRCNSGKRGRSPKPPSRSELRR